MDRIINTNKKLRANKISTEEYFKQQNSNIKHIDKVILSDEFYFFIKQAYDYALSNRIPINFHPSYRSIKINEPNDLPMMLFFLFSSNYLNINNAVDEFLETIFREKQNSENCLKLFMMNLYTEKHIFESNIQNFIMLKKYIDPDVYRKYMIKIVRNYPDAFSTDQLTIEQLIQNKECSNIFYGIEVFKIYDEEKNITYCLDEEEKEEYLRTNHNPYDPKFDSVGEPKNIILYSDAKTKKQDSELDDKLYKWTDQNYTNNRIFTSFTDEEIKRLHVTVSRTNTVLYRGMKYKCISESNGKCIITFNTFSSWTYSQKIAKHFAGKDGVMLKYTFTPDQLVADLTRIKNRRTDHDSEFEIIVVPGIYECEIIKDYDTLANFIDKCEISKLDENIRKIKQIIRHESKFDDKKIKKFFKILELLRNGENEALIDKVASKTFTKYNIVNHPKNYVVVCKLLADLQTLRYTRIMTIYTYIDVLHLRNLKEYL
jgi:hypothetical protein